MNHKLWLIGLISGAITGTALIIYLYLSKGITSAVTGFSGLMLLIALFQVLTLLIARTRNIMLTYIYSLLTLLVSSACSGFIVSCYFIRSLDFNSRMLFAFLIIFLSSGVISAIVSIFFRRRQVHQQSISGQLDDPNF